MWNVFIWGIGPCCDRFKKYMRHNKINILGYIDTYKFGQIYDGMKVMEPKEVSKCDFDYILIASQSYNEIIEELNALGIDGKRIIKPQSIQSIHHIAQLIQDKRYLLNTLKQEFEYAVNEHTDTLITGISYSECAINKEEFKYSIANLAISGQDIFYDRLLAKSVIENRHIYKKSQIKRVIIGLTYYSLEYDLSMSRSKLRTHYVYNLLVNDVHHCTDLASEDERMLETILNDNINSIYDSGFSDDELFIIENFIDFSRILTDYEINIKHMMNKEISMLTEVDKISQAKQLASLDFNKDYPETVSENIRILNEYIKYLLARDIEVYILVPPVTKYYYQFADQRIEKAFKENIELLKERYNIRVVDLYKDSRFDDSDFKDVSHLNHNGSIKLTRIINDII